MSEVFIPLLNFDNIKYEKYQISLKKNDTKYLEIENNILPYIQNRFDNHLLSFYTSATKGKLITTFDNWNQESQFDTNKIYENSFIQNYFNSINISRQEKKFVNLIHFDITLPFDPRFMDENFWFDNIILLPTKYFDDNIGKRLCLKLTNSILENISFQIPINGVVKCNVSLVCCLVDYGYYAYDVSKWFDYDVFSVYYNIDLDKPIESLSYSKTSNVSIKHKRNRMNPLMYIYDIYYDRLERYNGYIMENGPFSVDNDVDFYIEHSFYNETCNINFSDFIVPKKLNNDLEFILSTKNSNILFRVYVNNETKQKVTTRSINGNCVIEWL